MADARGRAPGHYVSGPFELVGQTQIARPEVILPTVVTRLRHVTDLELRSRLFTALLALLPAEEMITMVSCSNTKIWSWSCRTYGAFAKKAAKKATKKAGARVGGDVARQLRIQLGPCPRMP